MNILKNTESYTWSDLILCYVNYIPIMLFFKNGIGLAISNNSSPFPIKYPWKQIKIWKQDQPVFKIKEKFLITEIWEVLH